MSPHSGGLEADNVADSILHYLEEHPQAMDTLEGIAGWWVQNDNTPISMDALARVLDTLIERRDVQVVGTGAARRYRVNKPLDVRSDNDELERLATTLKAESPGSRTFIVLACGSTEQKTLAAENLAATLGLKLDRVDLSAVIGKYIGEREKNLDRVFERVSSSGAAVFFDEADALFGKRSEIKDAHDRYANLETTFLLQRIDAFSGLVLIATNDLEAARVMARRTRRDRSIVVRR
jgi:ATPase family associated with various cellular activities (AAA)